MSTRGASYNDPACKEALEAFRKMAEGRPKVEVATIDHMRDARLLRQRLPFEDADTAATDALEVINFEAEGPCLWTLSSRSPRQFAL